MKLFRASFIENIFTLLFFLLISLIVFQRIVYIPEYIFDERYYAKDAYRIYKQLPEENLVHPSLGKFLISVPMHFISSESPLSWRLSSAIAGILGLFFTFLLSRRSGLTVVESFIVAAMLLFSGSWLVLSRIAMLDIFLCLFSLLSGLCLFVFFKSDNFSRDSVFKSRLWLFITSAFFLGLAVSVKWSGAFQLLFVFLYVFFYLCITFRYKIYYFLLYVFIAAFVYICTSLPFVNFSFGRLYDRTVRAAVFHSTEMLPQAVATTNPSYKDSPFLYGGWKAMTTFLIGGVETRFVLEKYDRPLGISNNILLTLYYVFILVLYLLVCAGLLISKLQNFHVSLPPFFKDRTVHYLLAYSLLLLLPWVVVGRVHWNFYYAFQFPFALVLLGYIGFRYMPRHIVYVALFSYFFFGIWKLSLWMPI